MSSGSSDRQKRLAEALRNNLRRRKGQARARTEDLRGEDGTKANETPTSGDSDGAE